MLCGNFRRSIDKHGRIYIPKKLRNDFGKEKVVVIGYKDHVEIWTREQWAREQLETKKALDKIR